MQICGYDVMAMKFHSSSCYDIVSYDTTLTSLLINYYATLDFCIPDTYLWLVLVSPSSYALADSQPRHPFTLHRHLAHAAAGAASTTKVGIDCSRCSVGTMLREMTEMTAWRKREFS
jgi:hypothetical protein